MSTICERVSESMPQMVQDWMTSVFAVYVKMVKDKSCSREFVKMGKSCSREFVKMDKTKCGQTRMEMRKTVLVSPCRASNHLN